MQYACPLTWDIQQDNQKVHCRIQGPLNRFTLAPLWQALEKQACFPQNVHYVWHLDKITHLDSAGFALLCDLLRFGEQQGTQSIVECTPQILTLADLFSLTPWLKAFLALKQ